MSWSNKFINVTYDVFFAHLVELYLPMIEASTCWDFSHFGINGKMIFMMMKYQCVDNIKCFEIKVLNTFEKECFEMMPWKQNVLKVENVLVEQIFWYVKCVFSKYIFLVSYVL